jgi:uncharacterized protein
MIIDAHCHLGDWTAFQIPDGSLETMLGVMDRLGIERAISAHSAWLLGDWAQGFAESVAVGHQSGGRVLSYAVFDPRQAGSLEMVRRALRDRETFAGIKIHPSQHGLPADDDRYREVWQLAAREDVPILTHSWEISDYNPTQRLSFPPRFERFVKDFPKVTLILGHAGGRYHGHVAAAALAREHASVWLDLSGDCYALGLVEYLVEQAGADRILFGTDLNWIDPRTHIGRVLDAEIPAADKEKILRSNAQRLFHLR